MVLDNAMLFESSSSHMTYILLLSFEQDVYMVFDNAILFNPPGSDVHACAKTLKDKVREHINKRRRREDRQNVFSSDVHECAKALKDKVIKETY
jgi:hypothetical protein